MALGKAGTSPCRSGPCPRSPEVPAHFADKIRSYAAPPRHVREAMAMGIASLNAILQERLA